MLWWTAPNQGFSSLGCLAHSPSSLAAVLGCGVGRTRYDYLAGGVKSTSESAQNPHSCRNLCKWERWKNRWGTVLETVPSSGPVILCLVMLRPHHSTFKRGAPFRDEETEAWKESSLELAWPQSSIGCAASLPSEGLWNVHGMVEILNKVVRVGLIEKMIFESIFKGDVKSPKAF